MSKTQKKFVQQDFSPQPLLSEKEIRHGFKYTDISAVEVTGTMLGKTKIRKIHPQYQTKLRWLTLVIFFLIIVVAAWFTAHIEQQLDLLSTPTIKTVVIPLSGSTVELAPDVAASGQSTTPTVTDSMQIDSVKINQVKTEQIENGVAIKAGEVRANQMNAGGVKNPSVLKPHIVLPPDIEVHVPSTNALQNKKSVEPVEHLVDAPAPQPDAGSEEPPIENLVDEPAPQPDTDSEEPSE